MAEETKNSQYVSYPMFKGLQKPLEFMGIQRRYITWAAIAVGGAILGFIIVQTKGTVLLVCGRMGVFYIFSKW